MAGGIDWFRWHHGSTTDPKFALVARKAGVSLPDVLAVWANLLESASQSSDRGTFGTVEVESIDFLFGFEDGCTVKIIEALEARGLVSEGRIVAWSKRQPKREREDDNSSARVKAHRERAAAGVNDDVTPCNATKRQETPRGEESREEEKELESSNDDLSDSAAPNQTPPCPVAKIIAAYHAELPELAGVRSFPESAAKQLRKRWREDVERQSVAWWAEFFRYVKSCDYLVGKVNGFEADLIWLVGPRNFAKVLNGNYENRGRA